MGMDRACAISNWHLSFLPSVSALRDEYRQEEVTH